MTSTAEPELFRISSLRNFGMATEPPVPYDVQMRLEGLIVPVLKHIEERDERDCVRKHEIVIGTGELAMAALKSGDTRTANFFAAQASTQRRCRLPQEASIDIRTGRIIPVTKKGE